MRAKAKTTVKVSSVVALALLAAMGVNAGLFDKEKESGDSASGKASDTKTMFTSLDVNQDGVISPREAEANADVAMSFGELDGNRDGQLSAEEFSEFASITEEKQ